MSDLTDAVEALTNGVNTQGEAMAGALTRIQDDFTNILTRLDAALADDAEAAASVGRIRENLSRLEQSTQVLATLDPDPTNPVVPPPVDPPVTEVPPGTGDIGSV